jgi:transcriptional regulator with GAF, ATPase, and Fis domain
VIFDCSAFPENLLESELFGHEKGAFSGAIRTHKGVFERADGGTLFLDELGELPLNLQPKFLRALENGEIRRVGGERAVKVDVRVVAATNRNVATLVEEGKFRQDLFYRLAKVRLPLPGLRERMDDLPMLIDHFLTELRKRGDVPARVAGFAPSALDALRQYDWPGNVRELRNVVERAAAFVEGDRIQVEDLPADLQARLGHSEPSGLPAFTQFDPDENLKDAKERMVALFEREYLVKLLERNLKVRLYNGVRDLSSCNHLGNLAVLLNLEWAGKEVFKSAPFTPWPSGTQVDGHMRRAGLLEYATVLRTGHLVPTVVPDVFAALLADFLRDDSAKVEL